jgi:hypothetical protein
LTGSIVNAYVKVAVGFFVFWEDLNFFFLLFGLWDLLKELGFGLAWSEGIVPQAAVDNGRFFGWAAVFCADFFQLIEVN